MVELCEMAQKNHKIKSFPMHHGLGSLLVPSLSAFYFQYFLSVFFYTCDILWHLLNSALMGMNRELDSCLGRIIGRICVW